MSFLDHLEDLRWLVRSTLNNYGFCHVFFLDYLFDTIIFGHGQHLQPINFFDLSQSLG
jgi:hypothetical protein